MSALEEVFRRRIGLPFAVEVADGARVLEYALRAVGFSEWCALHPGTAVRVFGDDGGAVAACGGTVRTMTDGVAGMIVQQPSGLDMNWVVSECMRVGLWLVEDCAAGGDSGGRFGNASVFRHGDKGVIVTADMGIAQRAREAEATRRWQSEAAEHAKAWYDAVEAFYRDVGPVRVGSEIVPFSELSTRFPSAYKALVTAAQKAMACWYDREVV